MNASLTAKKLHTASTLFMRVNNELHCVTGKLALAGLSNSHYERLFFYYNITLSTGSYGGGHTLLLLLITGATTNSRQLHGVG